MNICIVGYGAIGPVHAESVSLLENVNLYAICDIDKTLADKGASTYNCKAIYDFSEVLEDKNIDSIHICTPHYLHFEMIKQAIDAGKSVVVEKPITMKRDEFYYLLKHYNTAPIFPIIQNRTNLCIKTLKELVSADDTLGKLIAVKGILTWYRNEDYYKSGDWRGTKEFEGGGVLINQAVHTLDLLTYFGGEVSSVFASASNKSLQNVIEVEDTVDAYIKFKNGAKGVFFATNAYTPGSSVFIELAFENAHFRYIDGKLYKDGALLCEDETKFLGKSYWGSGHERTLYDHYTLNKNLSLSDIKATMDTMFAIYESAEKNKEVIL